MSHEEVIEDMSPENMASGDEVGQFDSQIVRTCASTILQNDCPFDFFERSALRNLAKYLNPDLVMPPINVIKAYVFDLYLKEKLKLKQEFATIPNRISLTVDLWESCTTMPYICLTAHFVDADWKLNSKVLNFCRVYPPTGGEMCETMIELLNDWGIEKKIFSLTLDDSFENNVLQEQLKNQLGLQNGLLCDGEFFRVHCFARVLKLIVDEGLQLVSYAVCKIRESILFVRDSKSRMQKFKECVEKVGGVDSSVRLHPDMSMTVNSTYLMLESALKYRSVFESLHLYDDDYKLCPSVEQWKRVEKICAFLLPFSETVNMINGTTHPTSNLYFLQVWKVQCVLVESLGVEDEVIKKMAERMMSEFQKYWDEYSLVLALGAVLDPRMKLSRLAYCYSKLDASTCEKKLQDVKSKLYMLFDKYSSKSTSSGVHRTIQDQSSSMPLQKSLSDRVFDELKVHHQQLVTETGKSQLDIYLDESNLDFRSYEDMDVLQWWKSNNDRFPDLSLLACDLLSVPIATVASDYEFCMGSRVFNKYKDRMLPMNMDARFFTRSWLYNFGSNDGEDDDDDFDGEDDDDDFDGEDDDNDFDGEDGDDDFEEMINELDDGEDGDE
ncbi:zinc finger BED domain-containing protein RICESLEEPER 2-like isoform X2 [Trifolium pratense]|uniref:zinc finger BED domain-containing protein RICESLEEPER 2-like isoform X1 n=1 Tax=Trifolium pratense TaxID=57577 RepID=UPI001E697026|nr:zinc finger BED domain-containing protein RICESLEEPER 2-like isoform X1 [Trifolium pratense]XP_045822989.1 zinc finger BED domain-containing protein RICESLEEPER 2-like isoform X2 [Trifolium pratense]